MPAQGAADFARVDIPHIFRRVIRPMRGPGHNPPAVCGKAADLGRMGVRDGVDQSDILAVAMVEK